MTMILLDPVDELTRRRFLGAAGVVGVPGLSACGSDGDGPRPDATSRGGFPVRIQHELGTTLGEEAPARVVALSEADLDAAVALGVTPIATIDPSYGDDRILPWTLQSLHGERPRLLTQSDSGVDIEQVAALAPDLILAGGSFTIRDQYALLSRIAPTTAYETAPVSDPWQATVRQVGKALGRSPGADDLVRRVEGELDSVGRDHPELPGTEFAIVNVFQPGGVGVLRSSEDVTVRLFADLGLKLAPSVAGLPGEEFAVSLSYERLGVLDTDVLVLYAREGADDAVRQLTAFPLYQNLAVVQRGSVVEPSEDEFLALRGATALSLPFLVSEFFPRMAAAAAEVPA